jgi:TPR repeat protein
MIVKLVYRIKMVALIASMLCTSAYALTDAPPPIKNATSSASGEFTLQRGMSDHDFRVSSELEAAYNMAREYIAQGDQIKGLTLLQDSADAGHFLAMHDLGLLFRQANTKETLEAAAVWYRRAAEWRGIGFSGSQNNLGDMYETGEGLSKSPGDAIYWYTRSALQGEPTAYLSLGSCFANGVGVGKDVVEAYFWLTLAARDLGAGKNKNTAIKQRNALEKTMTPTQIAEAKDKADTFKPYYQTYMKMGDPLERGDPEAPAGDLK